MLFSPLDSSDFWPPLLNFAQALPSRVGRQLLIDFGRVQAAEKADGSLVTQSDQWADQELRMAIAAQFPDHGLLSEEVAHVFPDREWCWVIDPVDGTTNFTRGIPIWGISLGLLHHGTPVFGWVDFPPLNQTFHGFWGAPGHGNAAFMNQQPLQTRQDEPGANQFFSLCARSLAVLRQPGFPCKIRMLGAASYNLLTVAAGITLGAVEATPKIWDIAAVWPIVHAAGGVWVPLNATTVFPLQPGVNYGDRPYPTLVVSRPDLVSRFQPLVAMVSNPGL